MVRSYTEFIQENATTSRYFTPSASWSGTSLTFYLCFMVTVFAFLYLMKKRIEKARLPPGPPGTDICILHKIYVSFASLHK